MSREPELLRKLIPLKPLAQVKEKLTKLLKHFKVSQGKLSCPNILVVSRSSNTSRYKNALITCIIFND